MRAVRKLQRTPSGGRITMSETESYTAEYYRAKAEQCRRLALGILVVDDPARKGLEALAREYDAKADALAKGADDQNGGEVNEHPTT
jgi:hypothetical protein